MIKNFRKDGMSQTKITKKLGGELAHCLPLRQERQGRTQLQTTQTEQASIRPFLRSRWTNNISMFPEILTTRWSLAPRI
jgi:hypothetical protein